MGQSVGLISLPPKRVRVDIPLLFFDLRATTLVSAGVFQSVMVQEFLKNFGQGVQLPADTALGRPRHQAASERRLFSQSIASLLKNRTEAPMLISCGPFLSRRYRCSVSRLIRVKAQNSSGEKTASAKGSGAGLVPWGSVCGGSIRQYNGFVARSMDASGHKKTRNGGCRRDDDGARFSK
jgi:hypothetical protein